MVFVRAKVSPLYLRFLFAFLFLAYATPYQQQLFHDIVHQKGIAHHHHGERVHATSGHSEDYQERSDSSHQHSFRSVSFVVPVSVVKIGFPFHAVLAALNLEEKDPCQPGSGLIGFFSQAPPNAFVSKIYLLSPPQHAPPLA